MHSYTLPRLLLVGFMFALIAVGGIHHKTAAKDSTSWTEAASGEDEFVQACRGFNITSSYTSKLAYHVIENHSGDYVVEQLDASFTGALTNAENGQSLPYDGKFTRTTDYHIGRVTVSNLELRIQLPTPGDWTAKIDRQDMDLLANPVNVIQTVAKSDLASGFCVMLGRWVNPDDMSRPPYGLPSSGTTEWIPQDAAVNAADVTPASGQSDNVHTENSALPASAAPCDQPRMDPAYNC